MAVDRGYGTGTRKATPTASKPRPPRARRARGSAKPNTPLSQMSRAEYNARLTQQQGARRVQQRRNDVSANALEALTGFNRRDGVDAGDVAGLALAIPAGIGGAVLRAGSRLIPAGMRIAKAATRVSRVARGTRRNIAEPLAAARRSVSSELDNVKMAGSDAYSNYYAMERRIGSGPTDMLYGSEGKYIQRAKDAAYVNVNKAGEKAVRLGRLAERAAERSDVVSAADEIKRRLAALKRANRNR
jgi:hypothetical protein